MSESIKILLVEHNPDDIELILDELKAGGINFVPEIVETEKDYQRAIEHFNPDIILSDYSLPAFAGTEAFKIREEIAPDVPFIFVSGSIGEEKSIEYIKNGVTDYALKDKLFSLTVKVKRALTAAREKQEKIRTENELIHSETMLARAQRLAGMGSWELNFTDNMLILSVEGSRIFGLPPGHSSLSFESWSSLVHPEDIEGVLQTMAASRELLQETTYQHRIILGDGSIKHINSESKFEYDSTGNICGMFGTLQDITERKKAEEAIKKAYEEKNMVLERIDDGFFAIDENSIITYWNKRAEILLDVKKEDVIGKNLHEVFAETASPAFYNYYQKALTEKMSIHFEEFSNRTGKWFSVSVFASDNGLSVYFKDVTERKNSENKIKESELRYRSLNEQATDAICIADPSLRFIDINPYACETFGYSKEEALQLSLPDILFTEDLAVNPLKMAELKLGKTIRNERRLKKKDGTAIDMEVSTKIMEDGRMIMFGHDITARKIAEQSNKFKAELLNTIGQAVIATGLDGNINFWNKAAERMYGWTYSEAIGKHVAELIPTKQTAEQVNDIMKDLSGGHSWSGEFMAQRQNGESFPVYVTNSPVYDRQQKPSGVIAVSTDFTERKISEEKLKESEKKFRQIVETAQEGIWLIDENNDTSFVNKKMADLLEYSQEEMMGKPNYFFMDDEWKEKASGHIVSRKLGVSENHDFKYITKSGKELWTNISTNPVFDDDGNYKGALAMVTDITLTRKTAQNNKFKAELLNTIGQAVIATDLDGNINFWNKAAEEMYGWTYKKAIGKNIVDLIPSQQTSDQANSIIKKLSDGLSWSGEFIAQRQNGEIFPIYVTNSPVYDKHHKPSGIIAVSTDITERKKTEQEIAWLINNTEESFILMNRNLEITSFNDQAKHLYIKYLGKEFTRGSSILEYAQPERYDLVKNIYKRVLNGSEETDEITVAAEDLQVKNFALKYKPAKDEQGEIIGVFISAIDITENKKSQQKLEMQERRYRALVENGADAVAIMSPEGKVLYASPTITRMLGYAEKEILELDMFSLAYPDDKEDMGDIWQKVMSSPGLPVAAHAIRVLHKDGSWRWIEATMTNMLSDPSLNGIVDNFRDVTEKIEAEKSSEFERRDKEALINTTTDLIWSVSSDFKLIAANQAFLNSLKAYTGIALEPGHDLLMEERFTPGYNEYWQALYVKALEGNPFTTEVYTPAGDTYAEQWSETSFNPIFDGDIITGIACYSRDTTASKNIQNKIIQVNKKLKTAQQIAQLGYWELDMDIDTLFWSDEVYEIWGVTAESFEVTFKKYYNTIHPDDRKVFDHMQRNALVGKEKMDIEHRIILASGKIKFVHEKGELVYNDKGKAVRFEGTVQDITHRKELENLLNKANKLAQIGSWEVDLIKNSIYWSPITKEIHETKAGFTPDLQTAIGFYKEGESREIISQKVRDGIEKNKPWDVELQIITARGNEKWIRSIGEAEFANDKVIRLNGSLQDITVRKLAEIQLNTLNEDLKKKAKELAISNAELEQFAYVASHDLQEPLRMVTSFLTQLEKKYGSIIDDKGKQYIAFAVDGARRMRQIILDLLEFSRVGRTEESKEKINLDELVKEIQILLRKQISEKKAVIETGILPVIYAHKVPLYQVFQNLINNALKYSRENIPARILISAEESETHWLFTVSDNGIGIEKEYFDRIFIIFQRLHNKDEFSGTGMGLAVTKKIIENLGGKIWVESEEGKGSVFYFTILKQY